MDVKFDCVFHYVSDMERAVSFYVDLLGMELKSRDLVARFDLDGVLFELVPSPSSLTPGRGRGAHLCLRVEDLRATVGELGRKGIRVSPVSQEKNGWHAFFLDPDEHEIHLWQYFSNGLDGKKRESV